MIQPTDDRCEQGSFFHWISGEESDTSSHPWGDKTVMCASGRDAFRVLIRHGMETRGWQRLHVPCYYCQEVVESLVSTGIDVRLYPDGPEDPLPNPELMELKSGDVLLRVNFFGLRHTLSVPTSNPASFETIDDFSHDPWCEGAWKSDADWCVVSLRKTLPLPDGGLLWSPKDHCLPNTPRLTERHRVISLEKLAAMMLKTEYLQGKPIAKETYWHLAVSSEENLSQGHVSGMPEWTASLLNCFPVSQWRQQRQANHEAFCEAIDGVKSLRVLQVSDPAKACPFTVIMIIESRELRDHIRRELISRRVYPTTLWPLDNPPIDQIPADYVDLSRRMLSIQCDARYSPRQLMEIARLVRAYSEDPIRPTHISGYKAVHTPQMSSKEDSKINSSTELQKIT